MHGGSSKFVFFILAFLILVDIYAFKGLKQLIQNMPTTIKTIIIVVYWLVPVIITLMTFYIVFDITQLASGRIYYKVLYTFMGILVLFYVPKLLFCIFEIGNDLVNLFQIIIHKLSHNIVSSKFNLLRYIGSGVALLIFLFTLYGIIYGRYHYKINKIDLCLPNIPEEFNGFKIIHISDWHIGSFYNNPKQVEKAVNLINAQKADIIFFTGDLVNNLATEIDEFIPYLKKLKAKHGVYSVLGNHDYGEYINWENNKEKELNLERLKASQKEIGFNLLNNKSTAIKIGDAVIGICGVENWGLPPFPQYGNISEAIKNIDSIPFKILLSHDPSHWNEKIKNKTSIDLTLSGHTHGMQFGVISNKFKWSPVKYKYPQWAGLYKENKQYLYVNVGIGYIGFPGRVGIRPEIAVISLLHKID